MPHYKISAFMREELTRAVRTALNRKVDMMLHAFPVGPEQMMLMRWSDDEEATLSKVQSFAPGLLPTQRHVTCDIATGHEKHPNAFVMVALSSPIPWAHMGDSNRVPWVRGARFDVGDGWRPTENSRAYPSITLNADHHWCERRRDVHQSLIAWSHRMYQAARRFELGMDIIKRIAGCAETTTQLQATLPGLTTVLQSVSPALVERMGKAPVRTIAQYRLKSVTDDEICALTHLLAEGLILPKIEEMQIMPNHAVNYCYYEREGNT
jgi:hypothetical protein